MEYQAVSEQQAKILKQLRAMSDELEIAETDFRQAELTAECEFDKVFLLEKLKPGKQTDTLLKTIARDQTHEQRILVIVNESAYKKLKREYENLEKEWGKLLIDASYAKEELKRFSGQHEDE